MNTVSAKLPSPDIYFYAGHLWRIERKKRGKFRYVMHSPGVTVESRNMPDGLRILTEELLRQGWRPNSKA